MMHKTKAAIALKKSFPNFISKLQHLMTWIVVKIYFFLLFFSGFETAKNCCKIYT